MSIALTLPRIERSLIRTVLTHFPRWAWMPFPAFLAISILLLAVKAHMVMESPHLLATLNVLFCTSTSMMMTYLCAVTYRDTGHRSVLFLGSGALAFGLTFLFAGFSVSKFHVTVGIHNTGVLLSGILFLLSSFGAVKQYERAPKIGGKARSLTTAYLAVSIMLCLVWWGIMAGVIPSFYDRHSGFSALRHSVLLSAIVVFIASAILLVVVHGRSGILFWVWQSMGMVLIALGLGSVLAAPVPGSPLSWLGRAGQYLGGIYMLIAVHSLTHSAGGLRIPLRQALNESEQKYRALFESMNEAFALCEMIYDDDSVPVDYRFLEVNSAFERYIGLFRDQILGKRVRSMLPQVSVEATKAFDQVVKTGKPTWMEVRSQDLSRWFVVHAFCPLPGRFAYLALDITERRQAEESLREREQQLRVLNENLETLVAQRTQQVRGLSKALTIAELGERRRLSTILHEDLQQTLFAVKTRFELFRGELAAGIPDQQEDLGALESLTSKALDRCQMLALEFDPPTLKNEGLEASLTWLAEHMHRRYGLEVVVDTVGPLYLAREDERLMAVQLVREVLTLSISKTSTSQAHVKVRIQEECLIITIGSLSIKTEPIAEDSPRHHRLATISERIHLFGGEIAVHENSDSGTQYLIKLPFDTTHKQLGVE